MVQETEAMTLPEVVKTAKKSGQQFKQKSIKNTYYKWNEEKDAIFAFTFMGKRMGYYKWRAEFSPTEIMATNWILIDKE
jgi:hypothetical protein